MSVLQSAISHFGHHIPISDDGDDAMCEELKFFAKLIYVLTGRCSFEKKSMIEFSIAVSEISGYLSIICWLFAQLPQVIKNHERKSVEGVSAGFLTCWFAGDFLNFASCIMTEAMAFQVLLSGYYCLIDVILGFQWYYYTVYASKHPYLKLKKNQRLRVIKTPNSLLRHRLKQLNNPDYTEIDADLDGIPSIPSQHISIPKHMNSRSHHNYIQNDIDEELASPAPSSFIPRSKPMSFSNLVSSSFIMGFSKVQGAPLYNSTANTVITNFMSVDSIGKFLAWSCTFLYLSSRIPQLYTNYKKKSTEGVSILLFIAALTGNILYSLSLLTCEEALGDSQVRAAFWDRELSYFLGASLTVVFDIIMLFQWYSWDYKAHRHGHRSKSSRLSPDAIAPINSDPVSLNDTIETPNSPVVMLSPNHARKLSELIPLSPHDFLIDRYMGSKAADGADQNETADIKHVNFAKRVREYGSF